MLTKYSILPPLFLFSMIAFISAPAQTETAKTGMTAVTPRLEELQQKGAEALFNLDYEVSRQRFKEMVRLYPDDPTGPHMLATTLWLETLNQARRLQAAIYSTQSAPSDATCKGETAAQPSRSAGALYARSD